EADLRSEAAPRHLGIDADPAPARGLDDVVARVVDGRGRQRGEADLGEETGDEQRLLGVEAFVESLGEAEGVAGAGAQRGRDLPGELADYALAVEVETGA